jgi:NTP pyrophosphatase (non-canonical NTP hydrolase)
MSSYAEVELDVLRWGEKRQITKNGTAIGQAIKTAEECVELLAAINKGDKAAIRDAYGDIWVTMVMGAAILDINLLDCFYQAHNEIKDRTGTLGPDGIFVKD